MRRQNGGPSRRALGLAELVLARRLVLVLAPSLSLSPSPSRTLALVPPAPTPLPRPPVVLAPFGVLVLLPALVATLGLDVLSWVGRAQWLAVVLLGVGLVTAPWRTQRAWGPSRTGALAIVVLVLLRSIAGGASPHARLVVLPAGHEARVLDRQFEERDAAILGARLYAWTGTLASPEAPTLAPLLASAYDDMEVELGHRLGSVVLSTALGHDTGDAFAAFVVEPDGEPRGSVVFLHGYGGNFAVFCWQVAVAARAAGLRTVCPSTEITGHWSNGHGERIARAALAWARRGDVTILVGLSNGGVGASRLAPDLGHDLDALVLVSGVDPATADPGVPTLVIHGTGDAMMPASLARDYRDRHAERVRYVELEATHFLLLEQHAALRSELTRFFIERRDAAERAGASESR